MFGVGNGDWRIGGGGEGGMGGYGYGYGYGEGFKAWFNASDCLSRYAPPYVVDRMAP